MGGFGTNSQNWKKGKKHLPDDGIRDCVVPDPGKLLGQVDQYGAEALIVAYDCPPESNFRQLFIQGVKPHVWIAMHLFKEFWSEALGGMDMLPYVAAPISKLTSLPRFRELEDRIKKHEIYYYIGKKTIHSGNYGIKAPTFILAVLKDSEGKIRLSFKEGTQYLRHYRLICPEIETTFQSRIIVQLQNNRTIRNLFGYPRTFGARWGDELFKQAFAFRPQSTVGTITNIAITEIYDRIASKDPAFDDVDLLQNGHDSILFQAPEERIHAVGAEVRKHLERELKSPYSETYKMKTEFSVGKDWKNMKDVS